MTARKGLAVASAEANAHLVLRVSAVHLDHALVQTRRCTLTHDKAHSAFAESTLSCSVFAASQLFRCVSQD